MKTNGYSHLNKTNLSNWRCWQIFMIFIFWLILWWLSLYSFSNNVFVIFFSQNKYSYLCRLRLKWLYVYVFLIFIYLFLKKRDLLNYGIMNVIKTLILLDYFPETNAHFVIKKPTTLLQCLTCYLHCTFK